MYPSSHDPVTLLRFAIESGDLALTEALIARFARSRSLSARAMREMAGARAREPSEALANRTFAALSLLLGLDNGD